MRQTTEGTLLYEGFRFRLIIFTMILLAFCTNVSAQVQNIQVSVLELQSAPAGTAINSGEVEIEASWTFDEATASAPFSVEFRSGSIQLANQTGISANSTALRTTGAQIGNGSRQITARVTDANGAVQTGSISVTVQLNEPNLDIIINATSFTNRPGTNEVEFTVTSDRDISEPVVTITPNGLNATPQAAGSNPAQGTSFTYTMTLTSAADNDYTINVEGTDTTIPAGSENVGNATQNFTVETPPPGAGSISSSTPPSPTNAETIVLTGGIGENMDPSKGVEILVGGTVVANGTITGDQWSATVTGVSEGNNSYTMRGRDTNDLPSVESSPFSVVVDRTAPAAPNLTTPTSPTPNETTDISGTAAIDGGSVNSNPVTVRIFDSGGNELANVEAAADGSFSFSGIPLEMGDNQFSARAVDQAGNVSGDSNTVNVFRQDGSSSGSITASNPPSPTNAADITLSGTRSAIMDPAQPVEILEGTTVVATGNISGDTWTATITGVAEGNHSYTLRGTDIYGNPTPQSDPFNVTIDRTPPGTPSLNNSATPTTEATTTITGTAATDAGDANSPPVTVRIYNAGGTEVASGAAGDDGAFSIADVPLEVGDNNFYAVAEDSAGNTSGQSNQIYVFRGDGPSDAQLTVTYPGVDEDATINATAIVTLNATWSGGRPPYAATFRFAGNAIGSENTSGTSANFQVTGQQLGHGPEARSFEVVVIDPDNRTFNATGNKPVRVDLQAPVIEVNLNGSTFSNNAGSNEVIITVTSNKPVQAPDLEVQPDGLGVSPTADAENPATGTSFRYRMTLSSATSGNYVVIAKAKDTTRPLESANEGTGQKSFVVSATAPNANTITDVLPGNPTNAQNITLVGTVNTSIDASRPVEVLEGGSVVGTGNISGTDWTVNLSDVTEGRHTYTMRGQDSLGNYSTESAPYEVVIDRTAPSTPALNTTVTSPTNETSVHISGTGAIDTGTVTSGPVIVKLFNNDGTEAGDGVAGTAGNFTVANVPLEVGENRFYAIAYDSTVPDGNASGRSNIITIVRDETPGSSTGVFIYRSPDMPPMPLPLIGTYFLGAGPFNVRINYDKNMNQSSVPNIVITTAGGTAINATGGSWSGPRTYIGNITVPINGGSAINGIASINITDAIDTAGNIIPEYNEENSIPIDSTAPVASFNDNSPIYISTTTTSTSLSGNATDQGGSGIGYVELVWQSFSDASAVESVPVPIMADAPSPWSHEWDASALDSGRYKLWVVGADRANPTPNIENWESKSNFRIVIVDKNEPFITRISLGNMTTDISQMAGGEPPVIASEVTRLTAKVEDSGESGIGFNSPSFTFTLVHDESGTEISGNTTNNGVDTVRLDFANLTMNGTYTVSVTPADIGGNTGPTETRQFIIDREAPREANVSPAHLSYANKTNEALANSQVWAELNHPRADYQRSKIEVTYNGRVVGRQIIEDHRLVWDLHDGNLAHDQSHDGRYNVKIIPADTLGNVGAPIHTYFFIDSIPPVITAFEPEMENVHSSAVWFGLDQETIHIDVSDAPATILTNKEKVGKVSYNPGAIYSEITSADSTSWQNGNGSGLNLAISSFTYEIEGVEGPAATVSGNRMSIPRPAPSATEDGVMQLNMIVRVLDNVNSSDPNQLATNYRYMFDFLPPQIDEITVPDDNNNTYSGDILTVEGKVSDQGSSESLQVVAMEWSEDGQSWNDFNVSGLPAKETDFTGTIDISAKADGSYSLYLRARDLGGNYSQPAIKEFVVKRTPPAAPEPIVPLPDMLTNKQGILFKWASSDDAHKYLLQVADDPSFNNILNHIASSEFPSLQGQVTPMLEANFSVNKDGEYYWRVAAIEETADGYLISDFTSFRRIVIDTVKPTVVSVLPAPSSSNRISSGMVTFTIRFSETLDHTVPLTIKLTTAGGQVLGIEKTSSSKDTWIGTTVVPKNDTAAYSGNATISITNAADPAGNVMETDSANNVVISTAPTFTTKIFSNPANPFEIMIITRASQPLLSVPTCAVQQSTSRTPVTMNFLKERYYAGSYKINGEAAGKAYIDISGTDEYGMAGQSSVEFTVSDLSDSNRLNMTSPSGLANIKGAEKSAVTPSIIFMLDRDLLESPFASDLRASALPGIPQIEPKNGSELIGVLPLEMIGPANLQLRRRLLYTTDISDQELGIAPDKVHLYRLNHAGEWIFQGGSIAEGILTAELTGLGRMALMADMTAPILSEITPSEREILDDAMPEIKGQIVDFGAGVRPDSFALYINEQRVNAAKLDRSGNFSYKVRAPLPKGEHEIVVEAEDLAGNQLRSSFIITAPGAFAVDEFMPYPNPATGDRIFFNYNFNQKAERVRMRIYDTAGDLVADFDTFDFANLTNGRVRWNLRNNNGRSVANGVYFYRLQVTRNGQTLSRRGSFAVMR